MYHDKRDGDHKQIIEIELNAFIEWIGVRLMFKVCQSVSQSVRVSNKASVTPVQISTLFNI